jgi:hypothetical protein
LTSTRILPTSLCCLPLLPMSSLKVVGALDNYSLVFVIFINFFGQLKDWVGQVLFLVSCPKGQVEKYVNVEACFWCTGWAWNCQIIFRFASIHGRACFILFTSVWEMTASQLAKGKWKFRVASNIHFILAGLASRNLKTLATITGYSFKIS